MAGYTQLAGMYTGQPQEESPGRKKIQEGLIHILNGQTDEILAVITPPNILDNLHRQSLEDYLETFEFETFANRSYAEYLTDRNRLIIPSEDGGYSEFTIYGTRKYNEGEGVYSEVFSSASYLEDLQKADVIYPQVFAGHTASTMAGIVLNGTEWRPGVIESASTRTFDIENMTKPFALLKTVANEFDLELRFRVETDGNRITDRFVDLLERNGEWRGREVEFGRDLEGIHREENTENIFTALRGFGPENTEGEPDSERLEVFVEDEEALQRWGRPNPDTGELQHLIDAYEPQSDRQDMTEEELRQYTRTELNKRINSVVTYDVDLLDLEHVKGFETKKIRFGDTVRVKDTSFNPPLYVEARVFEQERDITNRTRKRIKLGDFVEFTEEQVHDVWRELRKEIREKISQAELIEYTYDKITIDDKDEVVFKDGKTFAEAVGIEAKEYAESQDEIVKQHADTVAGQAENNAKTYAEDRSAEALQQALAKSVAQEVYDNKMQEIADDLAERTTLEYVDGQLVDKANVGDVYTIEDVDNMFNNVVSITEYETDINGIVQTLDSQSTQIGQNVEAIGLKADSSRVDAIEGTVEDHNAQFGVMADQISSKVDSTYVRGAIADIEVGGVNVLKGTKDLNTGNFYRAVSVEIRQDEDIPYLRSTGVHSDYYIVELEPNATYTLSLDIRNFVSGTGGVLLQWFSSLTSSRASLEWANIPNANITSEWKRFSVTFTAPANDNFFSLGFRMADFRLFKLEKGNKATDWTPAPEDVQNEIDSVYSYASSEVDQLAGRIDLKAESSYVDGVESRVTTAEQTIDAIDGRISMVVSEQGTINAEAIASEISLTSSAIDLISSNINLVGAVTVLSDISGDLGTITAGEIYGAYIEGATIRQQGSQNYIEINNDGIFIKDNEFHQPRISIETLDMEYEGGGYFPSLIRFEKNVGEYNFAIGTNGAGLGTGFVGFLEQGSSNRNFEISNPGGSLYFPSREARFTGDVETSGSIKVGGGTGQWVFTNAVDNTVRGTHLYMRTIRGGEVRATENGTTGNYIPMRASSFPTSSSINTKTNREELSEYDAIRLLDNADVYKYHLINNVENGIYDKQKIGMFAETVPQEIRDENGVDPYSIVSVLWKVAQVQRKELTAMKQRIADLEMVI